MFGTAGFGGAPGLLRPDSGTGAGKSEGDRPFGGDYMCQGQMPRAVRTRYEGMEESPRRTAMLDNFDRALGHPDAGDLEQLRQAVTQ